MQDYTSLSAPLMWRQILADQYTPAHILSINNIFKNPQNFYLVTCTYLSVYIYKTRSVLYWSGASCIKPNVWQKKEFDWAYHQALDVSSDVKGQHTRGD